MDRQAYVEQLVDHYENPRNRGELPGANLQMKGGTPGCGDVVTMYATVDAETEQIEKVQFEGEGCTISQASASLLTEMVEGKTLREVEAMGYDDLLDTLGRDVVISRPKCATLSLDTLKAAVRKYRHEQRAAIAAAGEK